MKKILALVLALAMIMSSGLACAEAIKVGVIGPMTGAYAVYGLAVQYGAQIAAEEINAKGGIQFEVLAEDDQGDGELGVNAYNKLLDDGVAERRASFAGHGDASDGSEDPSEGREEPGLLHEEAGTAACGRPCQLAQNEVPVAGVRRHTNDALAEVRDGDAELPASDAKDVCC